MSRKKMAAEERIRAVKRYLQGEVSQGALARAMGIHIRTLQDWIRRYQSMGLDGLLERNKNQQYSALSRL